MGKIKCPVCEGKKWGEFLKGDDYFLEKCLECGLIKTISGQRDKDGGAPDFKNGPRYAKQLLDYLPATRGSLLDVGAGKAEFLVKEARKRGFKAMGIDPLVNTDLEHFQTKKKFDVIVLKHVLEHVGDLNRFLGKCHRLLNPGGTILISCPNIRSLMFYIFRDRWYGLQPGQHVWQFTPDTICAVLERNGFQVKNFWITNLDYQPQGFKKLIFAALLFAAKITHLGDQIILLASSPKTRWFR